MATAKMKLILPLVVWITWLNTTTAQSFGGIGFGIKQEVFFLNLEDGYFGCQVNESTDVLQLFELSKLCDGTPNCYLGSDELTKELKCTDNCRKNDHCQKDGCHNGACLDGQCYCNDGFGGCSCEVPDENECKYRPCDVFAHCTNSLGSFHCTCFPGYQGNGFHCEDINECDDPAVAARCVENSECCNLPAHFLCKCLPGYEGDGEVQCFDIDECRNPNACGPNAICQNTPGNYTCVCPEGFHGNPFTGCNDLDECQHPHACGPGAICQNVIGGRECYCPPGYEGDAYTTGCADTDECSRSNPCGRNALCANLDGSFKCTCPPGFIGNPLTECSAAECNSDLECPQDKACLNFQCVNPCTLRGACGLNALCETILHRPRCSCPECYNGIASTACHPDEKCLQVNGRPNKIHCLSNNDCSDNLACEIATGECIDPCENKAFKCRGNKKCEVHHHRPTCVCKKGFLVNDKGEISCAPDDTECYQDSHCSDKKACIEGICQNPCTATTKSPCPPEKSCDVSNHKPVCICLKNCTPSLSICLRDNGCPADQSCRAFRCEDPCKTANCPENTPCFVEDHKPKCQYCPPGYKTDPKYGCVKDVQCRSHDECTSQLACINKKCQNPCAVSNPCTQSHDCKVQDHQPVCVKVCQCQRNEDCGNVNFQCDGCQCVPGEPRIPLCTHCPPGLSCDPITGACHEERPTPVPKSCKSDMDCLESEACYMSQCQDPCKFTNACAKTAKCQTKMHRPICSCPTGYEGNPATNCFKTPTTTCVRNEECALTEACIGNICQRPCDVKNPCVQHAVCINTNHGSDCSCEEGFHGNGYVECQYVDNYKPICQYNEDCPPNKLCDRLNRICINPCDEDSCGENAECLPKDHGIECRCLPGYEGNPYTSCSVTIGCRSDSDCPTHEACIGGLCSSPCKCGTNAICDVLYHVATCKCPPGYQGDALITCRPPRNPCDPNPCGLNALCELDNGNPICFCPKGLTGNPFKNCIPEGDECSPNPCGPNSGCRVVGGDAVCFCLPEYEGTPPHVPCTLPAHPCDPSPCGPNTQCAVLSNGFAKCTCLPGFIESPNTIRGCIESKNPCEPNPCGLGAFCDPLREPICFCPAGSNGNPFRHCVEPKVSLCTPGPCGPNADCYIANNAEQCYCKQGYVGNPYTGCRLQPISACIPNPCGPGAQCIDTPEGNFICRCPEGMGGDPNGPGGCHGYECVVNDNCPDNKACIGYRCKDPCPGACGVNAYCKVERHHPICTCQYGLFGNPIIRCYDLPQPLPDNPCLPSPCGSNTICQNVRGRAVCSCLPDFQGDPTLGCQPECVLNSDCPLNKACLNRHCIDPCAVGHLCGVHATCQVRDHTATCICPQGFMGNPFYQCIPTPIISVPSYPNVTVHPCTPSPCNNMECNTWGTQIAICDPCLGPEAPYNPQCRPECLINADCPFDRACLGYTCSDPCPGSCGVNALCSVVLHTPICSCPDGLVGDPFQHCSIPLHPETHVKTCEATRCGENAECRQLNKALSCVCKPGFYGNPWIACRPECVINTDCLLNKACINNKCVDPCAGVCGVGAQCDVINHIPICYCPPHYTGDPFVSCYEFRPTIEPIPGPNPCDPSPCGPFSRCLISHQGFATCSCLPNYLGVPPVCKPECIVSSDCRQAQACVNQKCIDPCLGTCGANALCTVINHNPICSCTPGQQGDPFVGCYTPQTPDIPKTNENPCVPTPCGPNSICQVKENHPVCSCLANYIGSPPYCRPECTISQECPQNKACVREKCIDPCIELCGRNAKCNVINHTPFCSCKQGYQGDAFIGCSKTPDIPRPMDPCTPSPCAENSQCTVQNNIARCTCIPPYIGNPYVGGCKPECTMNSECASHLACLSQHCRDPCQGLCGINAECSVINHVPVCACGRGLIGDPFTACRQQPIETVDPCDPSPCGPNSVCRVRNEQAICSCQVGYFGTPPACRPECLVTSECSSDKACINQKCQDPCIGICGIAARCQVHNHNPICSCPPNHIGDPFLQCTRIEKPNISPCVPSPCGPNAECRTLDNRAVCSCLPNMYGTPPNCRPECLIDQDCPLNLACVGQKCKDPCKGSCGFNAKCNVVNHRPICSCLPGFEGDPFTGCNELPALEEPPHPCNPSPCGSNAICTERNGAGACTCIPDYQGDPYSGCRPECVSNSDCPHNKACSNMKCTNPCIGNCGLNAECTVINHNPQCYCIQGYTGNALIHCREVPQIEPPRRDPCVPSPCGSYSTCRIQSDRPVCSCLEGHVGAPPSCRPQCMVNSECPSDLACQNMRCVDPCRGTCGNNALCKTVLHSPICSCPVGFIGDPFSRCFKEEKPPVVIPENPCIPSPCGLFSECKVLRNRPVCSCLPNYFGQPPNCRPECTVNSQCPSSHSCINQRCEDPCPGSCGANAECRVLNHSPQCYCADGFSGDPFSGCQYTPQIPEEPAHPCNPSPCGANAICKELNGAGSCVCAPDYFGDPYTGCRPECVTNSDCPKDRSCVNQKCVDPCPGTCGINSECQVFNNVPNCYCLEGYIGDPFRACHPVPINPPMREQRDPCRPSPCGPYSQCRVINDHAVCSCLKDHIGTPPTCRPECIVASDCGQDKACMNQKCKDPCIGTCGLNARCNVVNHNPICSCPSGQTGDPFVRCVKEEKTVVPVPNENPCVPTPCGPNSQCRVSGTQAVCSCLPNYTGRAPNCRPECTINSECPGTLACINERCKDPCVGSCGSFATCAVINHSPNCICQPGYTGDPFAGCSVLIIVKEETNPCNPSPCGANAVCREQNGAGSCTCLPDYFGDPYTGCRPECVTNSDCSRDKACLGMKCKDPCVGTCGVNAECRVANHAPSCFCLEGYTGNPTTACHVIPPTVEPRREPCIPSPCGPHSQCRETNGHAVCSCLPDYVGSPPTCKPECMVSADCSLDKTCINQKCKDPCPGTCGINARCQVINHNPICSCPSEFIGDPFIRCFVEERPPVISQPENPCQPSPCGSNSQCRVVGNTPACSCLVGYVGRPPNCRPECVINADCSGNLACQREKCTDPCPGSCGSNTDCIVINHRSVCTCKIGYTGDPFSGCSQVPIVAPTPEPHNPCNPSPCGANAICREQNGAGSCTCLPDYFGDPYTGCRPECVTNTDCQSDRACINNKCKDPCPGTCGINAECHVTNHAPSCSCLPGFTGNPLTSCRQPPPIEVPINPCQPSPCGPYSDCREINNHAVCSCQPNYIGTPPTCKPECMVSSECAQNKACLNQKCKDPCPGTCGLNAKCQVVNHNPICSCPSQYTGDPFVTCILEEKTAVEVPSGNPCVPTPCGPNSQCRVIGTQPVCSCLPNYIGRAPNCRPECLINEECPGNLACQNEKCIDPCRGSCGSFTTCTTVKHTPICECVSGYTGDPFRGCVLLPPTVTEIPIDPCNPSPCGANAVCKERNGAGSCACVPEYFGDPYRGCRPECVTNSECDRSRACINNKCADPCPGTCGINAECRVINHIPSCICITGYTGDPASRCNLIPSVTPEPTQPCQPSPCGPNSQCREINGHAVCTCLTGYIGSPPMCRPECIGSSECAQDKACVNQKCVDPCPGTCGLNAQCRVVTHNPICVCSNGFTGDPFTSCSRIALPPPPINENPCVPSPCGANSQCRVVGTQPACSCLPNYIGRPPNCRPECVNDLECPNNLACKNEKCINPCQGFCGVNAICTVVSHAPVCSCLLGYQGDPLSSCTITPLTTERTPPSTPCFPSPCGPNAECREKNGAGACSCLQGFHGDPYDNNKGCHRECEINDDCKSNLACIAYKCVDPCPGTCGSLAECTVNNHIPTCSCPPGFTGDAFFQCREIQKTPNIPENPCQPTPCGPNSQCREVNKQAVCSCLPNYIGSPPSCRPECVVSSECPLDKACVNQKCSDPCPNTCGLGAQCTTRNHNPICACPPGYTGDPFLRCAPQPVTEEPSTERPASCFPSPCGSNSQCRIVENNPVCSCLPGFLGAPPNCRPECVISNDCDSQKTCIKHKCQDPCPGTCGINAECHVINHIPICTCIAGHTGDPFFQCNVIPEEKTQRPLDPCNPSPCGPNAECNNGICTCISEYIGNPYESCRPECVLSTECSRDKACIRNKCKDPCPNTCGQNARCDVINHIPTCSCPDTLTGDPFTLCRVIEEIQQPRDPCNPSPCGPNSQCKNINDHAVCSCIQGYQGQPPSCKPECIVNSECSSNKACVNQKCIDPCPGSCGLNADCKVRNYSPICSCREGYTGDPFQNCREIIVEPTPSTPLNPCNPSPCGPNSLCRAIGDTPSCSCAVDYIGTPPNCRPECVINPDCPSTQACINNKCKDPCPGSCGSNAECSVISHTVSCTCTTGYTGNPFVQCVPQPAEKPNPCEPSPCGPNAECRQRNGAGSCVCIQDYFGNPYEGCKPECVLSSDCPTNKACMKNKCVDPCPGICGQNAECSVINHVPACTCLERFIGNPFVICNPAPLPQEPSIFEPCSPSPCGPYSQCREVNNQAVCSCLPDYIGSPPNCKPECIVSSECPSDRACHKFKCANPCTGACGIQALCQVINHAPICSCKTGMTGDPFTRCYELPPAPIKPRPVENPCAPSPCGPNAECRVINDQASCSCQPNYFGAPPNCRPECLVNTDCASNLACITEKCRDPCTGSCGFNTECRVQNHIPICSCLSGYTGDAFSECTKIKPILPSTPTDPCNPSPCGQNAQCDNGICTCLTLYRGDPYQGCRPECTMNSDCSPNKACSNLRCVDPCPGTCGQNAVCDIVNHIPTCSCPAGLEGDPFVRCRPKIIDVPLNPCQPSPCGPNSVCRVNNGVAVCSCQPGLIGSPPSCRAECVLSAECPLTQACLNQKCIDPCPGTCGVNAKCQVINHNPICSCIQGNIGDPFVRCYPERKLVPQPVNPCDPTPCGPNSVCKVRGESPACSCLENYIGTPPNCRPECTINPECPRTLACINQKCRDPCPGSCGNNALCNTINHNPTCTCQNGYTGDPFQGCVPAPAVTPAPIPENPCSPSPCGPNAQCRIQSNYAVCECLPEYRGNPYELCKPECLSNADCTMNRACIKNKCVDPCPGTCGVGAECSTTNHFPVCSCPEGYTGDAFTLCRLLPEPAPRNPCNPSPCGINTACRVSGQNAVCECLPGFFGTPTAGGCKPECTISADCDRNKACLNQKCVDPCRGTCGFAAICNVINHSPVCSCPTPLIGDPFTLCTEPPKDKVEDPCNPSPCNLNGECRVVNGAALCIYPECIINQDCPRDRACYSQKCRDPCQGACGLNALCQVVNHRAICSCPPGHIGSPEVQCLIEEEPQPKVECTRDSDCTNDKACLNNRCMSPCTTSLCGQNAECRVQLHRAICTCRDGFTGNAQQACFEIGCRADSECPPTLACVNKECVDPCSFTSCGLNAICKGDYNHKARCYCPNNFRGDPFVRCERPECTTDDECPYNLACRSERCYDPCNCGKGAVCRTTNHRPQCSCPPGYVGNPLVGCDVEPEVQPECRQDADCPKTLACFNGVCKNPCFETNPCGKNTQCLVIDSLPLRTMSCMCLPGFVGDADTECKREPKPELGCRSSSECPATDACINRQCVNPCAVSNPCAPNAQCTPIDHKAVCKCPNDLIGNPFVKCYTQPQTKPECQTDSECSNDKSCINQKCQNPCELANPCSAQAECRTSFHRPTCSCPLGWLGNPQIACYKPECTSHQDCPYDKACIHEICQNPCSSLSCGNGAECIVERHIAQCRCPLGTQGNPLISCITGICHYNEDCADHEACDRLNRVCRPVCDEDTCADNAQCVGQRHEPKCSCPAGSTGNPFIKCVGLLPPEPACTSDSECQPQTACVNSRCMNPCKTENVCSADQECLVLDTLPLRTIMCQCPPDTIVDSTGRCVKLISQKPECVIDSECRDSDKCIGGICIEACRVDNCGVNALCTSTNHQAICTCSPGYTGNPHYECANVPKHPIAVPEPECYRDSDCTLDRTCKNERCINPCIVENPCARTAFCSVRYHRAECKCPENYEGNPLVDCIAPLGPTVGCTSNSDCSRSESCINRICASPCNCGPNAECKVINHYPTCYCKPGFSGNPQSGCVKLGCQSDNECSNDKQCYNGQCINPCILGNPCAKNAECYGKNHRATCKCLSGFEGNPLIRCERIECYVDNDCPNNRACMEQRCVDPCSSIVEPPCAQNAICHVTNHLAGCYCPPNLPEGNPLSYCIPRQDKKEPQCQYDKDCPSKLACIRNECVNPCEILSPCHPSAQCSVSDTVPVRTMLCSCPEGWVPNENGECHPVLVPIPPGCTSDSDCSDEEACINRLCTTPCDCGANADCRVQNHRAICSCKEGFEGNPNLVCRAVGCRVDSECASGKACINGNCINPCLVKDNCGINAECFVYQNRAECRCASGYRGNPLERCTVIGCLSNSDCPNERQCINAQCINPCIYDNPCSPRAECSVHNHLAVCRCPPGLVGNPYFDCIPEPQPECKEDSDCPSRLACLNNKCQDPCAVLEPCKRPAECQVIGTVPVRTMICVCPPGYISSGSGTCNLVIEGACASDSDCPSNKACFNGICKEPCNCGPNAECRIKNHKPICTCEEGFDGNPELGCHKVGCRADSECSPQHTCINKKCIPVCAADGSSCGDKAICYGYNHRAVCDCPPGLQGNPRISCSVVGCRTDTDCPTNRACINNKCELPCAVANPCDSQSLSECKVYNHVVECICPPGTISDGKMGCIRREEKCRVDSDCPTQFACIGFECVNPCNATEPCGINADCTVLDTRPVRTMVCICLPGYQGNAAVRCNPVAVCREDKGYVQTPDGRCECAPNLALNENYECVPCPTDKGLKVNERGHCVCALEKGLIIDERGNCVCPLELGYHFDKTGNCVPDAGPNCETDDDCPDHKYCNQITKTCEDACRLTHCGVNAFCNATNHVGKCQCITGYTGDAEIMCNQTSVIKFFKKPDLTVNCLSDGIQVEISLTELDFDGVLYVKGHSKDEKCRRVVTNETGERIEYFKVHFGECGLIHLNGEASFVLVIQKHLKLVTYKAQAYHIKCVYHTGEQNVTLGFNVSMLTTAGTIANTGPPPTCLMKIVTPTGEEINAAEIGDNLMLQVEVQPGSIYGGFARSCVAKTMEDSIENEYIVTDENGCATDPTIFGEWDYNPDTQSLLASFNAFKFPSSDNIRFQCNIRVCFGKCQPVNCRGYNAFGRRKRSTDNEENDTDLAASGDLLSGQLREEVTIQSNAILTLERREEKYPDPQTAANAQRAEDICVSMIGFIIALIITALLALVAVAVAVSCWLMAYRRRPKSTGPLPHPPEFPNPLFTTPEPMAEPSPDYLT